jgi:hypothetical protein
VIALVQLDGNGKAFVRRIEVVAQDEPVRISLRRPFGGGEPEQHVAWVGNGESRDSWAIRRPQCCGSLVGYLADLSDLFGVIGSQRFQIGVGRPACLVELCPQLSGGRPVTLGSPFGVCSPRFS